jgi:ubiquinone/menaquinone biosynthesis C-methylase UbiE
MANPSKSHEKASQHLREDADIGTSSEDYARRFTGGVGRWFVATQKRITLGLLQALPAGASILDVGGGHGQIAPPLIEAGYSVTVVGSDPVCARRLEPWIKQGRCHFEAVNLQSLPYPDHSFDAVVCLRLLPHSVDWNSLIGELCRVARRSVILDYPSSRSVNVLATHLFSLKRRIELNTRRYLIFAPHQIHSAFLENGFSVGAERAQFLLPMALHRFTNRAALSKVAETPGRLLGLTRRFGSPKIIRADRRGPSA